MAVLRRAILLLAAVLAAGAAGGAPAPEYEIKAAFLYNFAKFVEWPPDAFADPASPLSLCVFGADPFGGSLETVVRGETLGGRRLAVRRVRQPDDARSCHVLFVGRAERGRIPDVLAATRDASVLTVGESEGFLDQGGVIQFILAAGKVRFEIDAAGAERARLKISSKLMRLAVERAGGG
jgi:uncharacterized protein DUF4154